ncbi:DUF1573 domain-containing protein [Gilvimarinus agarilyticus]|nr:DUF1573 domain-containing protein [Gilvimarinus agarilyticus]
MTRELSDSTHAESIISLILNPMNKKIMMRYLTLCIGMMSVLGVNQAVAQDKLKFIETTYDFGQVKEEDGPVMHEFEFENVGEDSITITYVKASCGCTTPDWTREPVAPGDRGFVRAQYNPRNRPGSFSKSLRINSSGAGSTYVYIKGMVIPRKKTLEEELPIKMGALRVQNTNINLGRITTEKESVAYIEMYNDSEDTVRFLDQYDGPAAVVVTFDTLALAPKEKANVMLTYDPNKEKDALGSKNYGIAIYTDEEDEGQKNFNVRASVREYFAPMTDGEKAKAPKLSIDDKLNNAGRVNEGQTVEVEYTLVNTGAGMLDVRKVESSCACLVAELDDYTIKSGKSASMKLTLDTSGMRGGQNKTVYIYSNDPQESTQVVTIRVTVIKKG